MSIGLIIRMVVFGVVLFALAKCAANVASPVAKDRADEKDMMQRMADRDDPYQAVVAQLETLNLLDQKLRDCIVEQLRMYEGKIIAGNMSSPTEMTRLICWNKGIVSLEGLEHFTALKTVDLSRNKIVDIKPLGRLQALETLNLGQNRIESLWTMFPLPKLKKLDLRENPIRDIDALHQNPSLETVEYVFGGTEACASLDQFFDARNGRNFFLRPPRNCVDAHGDKVTY
ncbi:leucine-rich repeat domain-containing protein [Allohahella marinimesophila]|uniref:Leucine rich repeat (LRR) protein n=1 Tax=Allohahella marinimesophila TaxID=1054972 RepID=A0ABP7Q2L6_9GAMM